MAEYQAEFTIHVRIGVDGVPHATVRGGHGVEFEDNVLAGAADFAALALLRFGMERSRMGIEAYIEDFNRRLWRSVSLKVVGRREISGDDNEEAARG